MGSKEAPGLSFPRFGRESLHGSAEKKTRAGTDEDKHFFDCSSNSKIHPDKAVSPLRPHQNLTESDEKMNSIPIPSEDEKTVSDQSAEASGALSEPASVNG